MSDPVSDQPSAGHQPRWRQFDEQWYLLRYPEVRDWMHEEGHQDLHAF